MSAAENKAVFLSYASQDVEAARRICEVLRATGVEVWFDQNELVGGDAWDAKIRKQIKECALFVPLISANTQARTEGYFRLEWRLADQRTHLMAKGRPFLLPVVIDETRDGDAHVPDSFTEVQWTRLHGGEMPAAFGERVKKLLGSNVAGVAVPGPRSLATTPATQSNRRVPAAVWAISAVAMLAVALFFALRKTAAPVAAARPLTAETSAGPLTDAQKLVAQARVLFQDGDDMNHENFFLAEDLLKRALALDATDGTVWAVQAELSADMMRLGYDRSGARRERLRMQAERAVKLAPESVEAQVAYGGYLELIGGSSAAEAVRLLTQLGEQAPANRRVFRSLGLAWVALGKIDEAVAAFDRMNAIPGGDPAALLYKAAQFIWYGRYQEAETAVSQSLALRTTGRGQVLDVLLKLCWRGDIAAAVAALERWPAWLHLEPRGAFVASQVWLWKREPDKAVEALNALAPDFLNDTYYTGPKSSLLALAHEMAGRPEAARAEWENSKKVANRLLAEDPTLQRALALKACALARLGERAEAESLLRQLEQTRELRSDFWSVAATSALLRIALGHGAEVAAKFNSEPRSVYVKTGFPSPQAALRLNPVFDPIRATQEFQRLIASAPVPKPKHADAPAVAVDEKSVAVLAFENKSDDPANELFSDGLSEDLIGALGRVPGLTVTGWTSSLFLKSNKNLTTAEIGKQLGVTYVVRGSVYRSGDNMVRITAQVSRAANDVVVWASAPLNRELKDNFKVRDEIADLIAQALSLKLGVATTAAKVEMNPVAYRLYLEGRRAWHLRTMTGYERAEALLTQALALEPKFAGAHAALADVAMSRAEGENLVGQFQQRDSPVLKKIGATIQRALELDPSLVEGHAALGRMHWMEWKFPDGIRDLRLALALNPNYATAHQWLGRALMMNGQLEEGLSELKRAYELDPLSAKIADNYSLALLAAQRPAEALDFAERALVLQPESMQALGFKAIALAVLGRNEEAIGAARRRIGSANDASEGNFGYALARAGARSEAELVSVAAIKSRPALHAGTLLALGKREECLTALQAGTVEANAIERLYFWPDFDSVRADPRFVKILGTLGVTEAHARAQAWRKAHRPDKVEAKR